MLKEREVTQEVARRELSQDRAGRERSRRSALQGVAPNTVLPGSRLRTRVQGSCPSRALAGEHAKNALPGSCPRTAGQCWGCIPGRQATPAPETHLLWSRWHQGRHGHVRTALAARGVGSEQIGSSRQLRHSQGRENKRPSAYMLRGDLVVIVISIVIVILITTLAPGYQSSPRIDIGGYNYFSIIFQFSITITKKYSKDIFLYFPPEENFV